MVRQAVDQVEVLPSGRKALRARPLGHPVGRERLECLHNARVQHSPPVEQEAAIGDLVRQVMFEGVGVLWEAVGLIEELGRLEAG